VKTNMYMMTQNAQRRMFQAQLQVGEHETLGISPKLQHSTVSTVAFFTRLCCIKVNFHHAC